MSYKIIGKYIKDLDFQIPNPKVFFSLSKDISSYKINIDIKSNQIKQNIIEVLTSLNLKTKKESIVGKGHRLLIDENSRRAEKRTVSISRELLETNRRYLTRTLDGNSS